MSEKKLTRREKFLQSQFVLPMFWDSVVFPSDWTLEEILELHENLFNESLSVLKQSGTTKAQIDRKIEVLEWIYAPDEMNDAIEVVNGKAEHKKMPKPFSFHLCCQIMEVDPDEMRNQIFFTLESNFKKAITAFKKAA